MIFLPLASAAPTQARIKDIARIDGVRDNVLQGVGLVVGLDNTGDNNNPLLNQLIRNYARNNQLQFPIQDMRAKNTAAVVVTCVLPAYARSGSTLDVHVSSMGNAKSLQGGTLLVTALRGPDGQVHALAQGPLSIGGFQAAAGGSSITKNHPTVGKIPNGAIVEGDMVPTKVVKEGVMRVVLNEPDFTTANNIADALNAKFGKPGVARAADMGAVELRADALEPLFGKRTVELIASVEETVVETDEPARVVIDEKTGTVVVGQNVRISTVAVSHSDFVVEISQTAESAIQATPFDTFVRDTTATTITAYDVNNATDTMQVFPENVTINDLVRTINAVNMPPRDLISILQAIKQAGALKAELVIW